MKKFILTLLYAFCFFLPFGEDRWGCLYAQTPTQEWEKRFTNGNFASGYSVKLDSSGNVYVLVGNSQADSTNGDYCVIKYSNSGTLLWTKFYNSPGNLSDQPKAFDVSGSGDIYITGTTIINFSPRYITTVKFNADGVLQWAKIFSGSFQYDNANDIKIDHAGNIVIIGSTSIGSNMSYSLTIKYNPLGDSLWVKKLTQLPPYSGNWREVLDDSNNIYIVGDYGNTNVDYLMLKYNADGDLQWYTTYNSPQNYDDVTWGIDIDTNRNLYIIGSSTVPSAQSNNTLVKVLNNGTVQWESKFTGIITGDGHSGIPAGVISTPDGSAIYYATFCQNFSSGTDMVTLKYNSAGDTQWVKRYWGGVNATQNQPAAMSLDINNNLYVAGVANYSISGDDYVTIKYLPNGIQQWVVSYNGPLTNSFDYANGLVVDSNFVYVTGTSSRFNGNPISWDAATIKYNQPIGISNNNNSLPVHFKLHQNYPNPFNGTTIINYEIPVKSNVQLKVYNSLGQLVKTLVNREQPASYYTIIYNTEGLSSGVYFYSLVVNNNVIETRKFILTK